MSSQSIRSQQVQTQLANLANDIQDIRNAVRSVQEEAQRLRAAAKANDEHLKDLEQRYEAAVHAQEQLLRSFGAPPQPTGFAPSRGGYGTTDSSSLYSESVPPPPVGYRPQEGRGATRSSSIYSGSLPPPPPVGYRAHHGHSASPSGYPSPFSAADPEATPRAAPSRLHRPQETAQIAQPMTDSMDNANFLPMVIENLLATAEYFKGKDRLQNCQFITERRGNQVKKCPRKAFDVQCFRDGHFTYCRTHIRVIPTGMETCNGKQPHSECVGVFWEDREDWETMVDCAYETKNIGRKGVDEDVLYQALFPPEHYAGRYM